MAYSILGLQHLHMILTKTVQNRFMIYNKSAHWTMHKHWIGAKHSSEQNENTHNMPNPVGVLTSTLWREGRSGTGKDRMTEYGAHERQTRSAERGGTKQSGSGWCGRICQSDRALDSSWPMSLETGGSAMVLPYIFLLRREISPPFFKKGAIDFL